MKNRFVVSRKFFCKTFQYISLSLNCLLAEEHRSFYIRYVSSKEVRYIGISLHFNSAENLLNAFQCCIGCYTEIILGTHSAMNGPLSRFTYIRQSKPAHRRPDAFLCLPVYEKLFDGQHPQESGKHFDNLLLSNEMGRSVC